MSDGATTYTVRRSALEPVRTWTISQQGLSWTRPGEPGHFPYSDISAIRLEWTGSRFDRARYATHVTRFNGWTETIVSTSYESPGRFTDQSQDYARFVTDLVALTYAANPACKFLAGASGVSYVGSSIAMAAGLLALAAVGLSIGIAWTWLIVAKLVVVAWLLPLALRWIRRNRPRAFVPPAIPANVMPALTPP